MRVAILRDLRAAFGETRDQGLRPTCIAFAASDLHAAVRAQPFRPLSVEHLYWHAVRHTLGGRPEDGVSLPAILDALDRDGQALEAGWPYLAALPSDLAAWRPPSTATPAFRCGAKRDTGTAERVIAALDDGRASLVALRIGANFFAPVDGVIAPEADELDLAYHAVVAVAHGTSDGGAPFVLVRNSWGPDWGVRGHALLPAPYLDARAIGLALATEARIA